MLNFWWAEFLILYIYTYTYMELRAWVKDKDINAYIYNKL